MAMRGSCFGGRMEVLLGLQLAAEPKGAVCVELECWERRRLENESGNGHETRREGELESWRLEE